MSLRLLIVKLLNSNFASAPVDNEFGVRKIPPFPSKSRGWRRLDTNLIVKEVVTGNN